MPLLNDQDYQRSVRDLIQDAEDLHRDEFDMIHVSLENGRELLLVAIVADYLDPVAKVLEAIRELREES
ncbi:hypothetical protein B6S59_25235 [Pseudomonas sp. A46]|nr:hypothetical protein [Pseudomonas sp. A46]OWJ91080.1 hypothetical protein B6S59_25235 [Pseudomonas sp. A46]